MNSVPQETKQTSGWYLVGIEGDTMFGPLAASDVQITYDIPWSDYYATHPQPMVPLTTGWHVTGTFKCLYVDNETFYAMLGRKPHWTERLSRRVHRLLASLLVKIHVKQS